MAGALAGGAWDAALQQATHHAVLDDGDGLAGHALVVPGVAAQHIGAGVVGHGPPLGEESSAHAGLGPLVHLRGGQLAEQLDAGFLLEEDRAQVLVQHRGVFQSHQPVRHLADVGLHLVQRG